MKKKNRLGTERSPNKTGAPMPWSRGTTEAKTRWGKQAHFVIGTKSRVA